MEFEKETTKKEKQVEAEMQKLDDKLKKTKEELVAKSYGADASIPRSSKWKGKIEKIFR